MSQKTFRFDTSTTCRNFQIQWFVGKCQWITYCMNTNTCVYKIGGHKKHTEIVSTNFQLFTSHFNFEYNHTCLQN